MGSNKILLEKSLDVAVEEGDFPVGGHLLVSVKESIYAQVTGVYFFRSKSR